VKLSSQALNWLAFAAVVPSSLSFFVRSVAVVNEQTKQSNISDKVQPAHNIFNHRSDLPIIRFVADLSVRLSFAFAESKSRDFEGGEEPVGLGSKRRRWQAKLAASPRSAAFSRVSTRSSPLFNAA
jgi:hypothetical protein